MNIHEKKIINTKKIGETKKNSHLSIEQFKKKCKCGIVFKTKERPQEKNEPYILMPHLLGFY